MSEIDMRFYSAALDEMYRQRASAGATAEVIRQVLAYQSLPVRARRLLKDQLARVERAARGHILEGDVADAKAALRGCGASELLTRAQWEQEVDSH